MAGSGRLRPSPLDKALGRREGVRKFFVDVHWKTEKKPHIVYDGLRFRKVRRLSEIDAGDGDEVYVDTLPINTYEDIIKLLQRGVRVFVLKRLDILPQLRTANGLSKTDTNDAKILSMLTEDYYRELYVGEIELRMLLLRYHGVQKVLALAKQRSLDKEFINSLRRSKHKLARTIVTQAKAIIPNYRKVLENLLPSHSNLYGQVALAEILLNIDFSRGLRRAELASSLDALGFKPFRSEQGYTKSHQIYLPYPEQECVKVRDILESCGIFVDLGVRIGTAEVTRRGMGVKQMSTIAKLCKLAVDGEKVASDVRKLALRFKEVKFT